MTCLLGSWAPLHCEEIEVPFPASQLSSLSSLLPLNIILLLMITELSYLMRYVAAIFDRQQKSILILSRTYLNYSLNKEINN